MKQRICPICDTEMKSAHYCKNCNCWVKQPYIRDVTYHLNERHPKKETDCTYHTTVNQNDTAFPSYENMEQPPAPSQPHPNWQPSRSPQSFTKQQTDRSQSTRTAFTGKNRVGLVIIGTILLLKFLTTFSEIAFEQVKKTDLLLPSKEYDIDLGDFNEESDAYTELTDAEVIRQGIVCNSRKHFKVTGEELESQILRNFDNRGVTVSLNDSYSYNELHQESGSTWYATYISYWLESDVESDDYDYLELDTDTATGALHEITINMEDPGQLGQVVADVLELLEQAGEIGKDAGRYQQVRDALTLAAESLDDFQYEQESVLVWGSAYDTTYTVTISRSRESE